MKFISIVILWTAFLVSCRPSQKDALSTTYEADWESLAEHDEAPEWFADSKLGIYFHWGVYSVPAYDSEWYPRWMHFEGTPAYDHHVATYGHPSEFGYHDFVPMFTADYFDPEDWVKLFKDAGARWVGPVAEHHDGFAMWDSDITPWNAKDRGPKRDITGEIAAEARKQGLKLITTFHHSKQLQRYDSTVIVDNNGEYPYKLSHFPYFEDMPTSSDDPELQMLYGNMDPDKWHEEVWLGKVNELVDRYQPDIIWFDYVLDAIPEKFRQEMCANYLNKAAEWDKEVVIVRKQDDLPINMSVDDLEKSRKKEIDPKVWMTDETVSTGSWCYTENLKVKSAAEVTRVLIDIVSKNGVLLLNVSPKADGTIPNDQRQVLLEMGDWLKRHGEAIYGSRPWTVYGQGPTVQPEGHFDNHREFLKLKYSNQDIRYTTQDKIIYATILGLPEAGSDYNLNAFSSSIPDVEQVVHVEILGQDNTVSWSQLESGLKITIPEGAEDPIATVIKITTG
ncbi:MAG: alpha-L-fucosidase [Bacteroidota bacterium]